MKVSIINTHYLADSYAASAGTLLISPFQCSKSELPQQSKSFPEGWGERKGKEVRAEGAEAGLRRVVPPPTGSPVWGLGVALGVAPRPVHRHPLWSVL